MTNEREPAACEAPVFYATGEGQTRKIAERLAELLRARGIESRAFDMKTHPEIDWTRVRGALVGASLHAGRHQREAAAFVAAHAADLNRVPSAFWSVSLSAASANADERAAAQRIADEFVAAPGWHSRTTVSIAGCLAYTRYGFFKRLLMKRIARKEGGSTDTSRDHELTDWGQVEALARTLADLIGETVKTPPVRSAA